MVDAPFVMPTVARSEGHSKTRCGPTLRISGCMYSSTDAMCSSASAHRRGLRGLASEAARKGEQAATILLHSILISPSSVQRVVIVSRTNMGGARRCVLHHGTVDGVFQFGWQNEIVRKNVDRFEVGRECARICTGPIF